MCDLLTENLFVKVSISIEKCAIFQNELCAMDYRCFMNKTRMV